MAPPRRRQLTVALVVLALVIGLVVGLLVARDEEPIGTETTGQSPTTPDEAPSPPPSSTSSTSPSPTLPDYEASGVFTRMPVGTPVRGRAGQLVRYRVEVEQGSGVTSRELATVVDATLRHRRGWTAGGHWRFQRVVRGEADVTIRLATPSTVDRYCAAGGATTEGYSSCRAGDLIMLNLDRWLVGVPHVRDLALYRAYLVNHEVGHVLGKGHERCPAPGRLAPVMLQQTLGLQGCEANAWPRTGDGRMISGPPDE